MWRLKKNQRLGNGNLRHLLIVPNFALLNGLLQPYVIVRCRLSGRATVVPKGVPRLSCRKQKPREAVSSTSTREIARHRNLFLDVHANGDKAEKAYQDFVRISNYPTAWEH